MYERMFEKEIRQDNFETPNQAIEKVNRVSKIPIEKL